MSDSRLFFGLWPSPPVRDALSHLVGRFSRHPGRPHHAQDLHMTLVFLGAVPATKLGCITQVAERIRSPGFDLRLQRLGFWTRPRILWTAPDATPEQLSALVRGLQEGLAECGFEAESRPYRPHVTLLRKSYPVGTDAIEQPIDWPVNEFVLAESTNPQAGGQRYRIVQRWHLNEAKPEPDGG
ncbi:MAG: RNA 2',3'-cyclic phosphodiesterase [Candidatus Thiodiazotropha sp.]